jgi:hypothetical protein
VHIISTTVCRVNSLRYSIILKWNPLPKMVRLWSIAEPKANQGKTKQFLHAKYTPKIAPLGIACSATNQNFQLPTYKLWIQMKLWVTIWFVPKVMTKTFIRCTNLYKWHKLSFFSEKWFHNLTIGQNFKWFVVLVRFKPKVWIVI